MSLTKKDGVWFVYDGECPLCTSAAQALRIQKEYGSIHLINAREAANDPLIHEITRRGFDLDEGMVIYASDRFYHAHDALQFMACCGESRNLIMMFCKSLFWSKTVSFLVYPLMRCMRNWLLQRKGVGRINNLKSEAVHKSMMRK